MGKGIFGLLNNMRDSEAGNIFFTLFGAVALVGAVGAASMTVMKGPVKGIADITNRTIAENNILSSSRLAITSSVDANTNGDCDSDGIIEPIMFDAQTGGQPVPVGGGHLPETIGSHPNDPWGTRYGYCVWDHGSVLMNSSCDIPPASGTNRRLAGTNTKAIPVLAIMSAGPDRRFQTSCRSFAAADAAGNNNGTPDTGEDTLVRVAGSDDIVIGYTYAEANASAGDIWKLKAVDPDTAEIAKNLEIRDSGGTVSASIDATQGMGDFARINTDAIYAKTTPNGTTEDLAQLRFVGRPGDPPLGMPAGSDAEFGACSVSPGVQGTWSDGTYYYATRDTGGGNVLSAYTLTGTTFNEISNISSFGGGLLTGGNGKIFVRQGPTTEIAAYSFNGATFTSLGTVTPGGTIHSIWANNTHVFVTTSGPNALRAYTHAGSTFTLVASYTTFASTPRGGHMKGSGSPWTVFTVDLSGDIRAFSFNGTTFTPAGSLANGTGYELTADGIYIYTASGFGGLRAYSYGAGTFTHLASYTTPGMINTAWAGNNHIYTGGMNGARKLKFNGTEFIEIAVDEDIGIVYHIRGTGSKIFGTVDIGSVYHGVELEQQSCGGKSGSGVVDLWNATASDNRRWYDVAGGATSSSLVATVSSSGFLYRSTSGGATWDILIAPGGRDWRSVAASADGTRFVAAAYGANLFTSADSGTTWTSRASAQNWEGVTSSANGQLMAATIDGGPIHTSGDYGVNWVSQAGSGSRAWRDIASSADGTRLAAIVASGFIYTSTNSGVTWTQRATSRDWHGIASSSDGLKLAAVDNGGFIYTSTDGGANWLQRGTSKNWTDIAMSSDGIRMVAVADSEKIYTSNDSGAAWQEQTSSSPHKWKAVWSNNDGSIVYAAESLDGNNGRIWIGVEGNGESPDPIIDQLSCGNTQIPKWNGGDWVCAADADNNSLNSLACANGQIVKRVGGVWACGTDNVAVSGDHLGNHTATQGLNMATRNISGINIITATAYFISSDRNLKTNIQDIVDPHGLLDAVHGRHYTWKNNGLPAYGVIAQDVTGVMPEAVQKTEQGTLAVEYDQLIPAMIEATKDLKARNDALRTEIDALKQQTP